MWPDTDATPNSDAIYPVHGPTYGRTKTEGHNVRTDRTRVERALYARSERLADIDERHRRRCPKCTEAILAAAHVCNHCGARLDPAEPTPPYPPPV